MVERDVERTGLASAGLALAWSVGMAFGPCAAGVISAPDGAHAWPTRKHDGVPSVAVSPKSGRLWATWFCGPTDCEDSNNYVVLVTSTDRGESWKTVLVCDPDGAGPIRAFDPQVWVPPDGTLRWSWTERKVPIREGERNRNTCLDYFAWHDHLVMATLDAEQEPKPPYPQTYRISSGFMVGKPSVLRDGTWVLPVAEWQDDISARLYASTDGGVSFRLRGGAFVPKANRMFEEHSVIELADGSLRAYIRATNAKDLAHCTFWAESRDAGRTWSDAVPCRFTHTCARIFVRRLRSGALLMVKNGPLDRDVGRNDLTAYVSDDDGATWTGQLLIRQGPSAYTDGDQSADGTVFLIYDVDRTGLRINGLARFTEADVRAGKIVSPGSRLDLQVREVEAVNPCHRPVTGTQAETVVESSQSKRKE